MTLGFKFERRPGRRELGVVAAILSLAVLVAWFSPFGRWTALFSFDAMSVALRNATPEDTILVYLDERSHEVLRQPYDRPWDRRLHARLLERLRADGARLVYFDIVFEQPSPDEAADAEFADAISRHGSVVLGGSLAVTQEAESIQRRIIAPLSTLRRAARAWGSLSFLDSDSGARRVPPRIESVEHAAWNAAQLLHGNTGDGTSEPSGWIHYCGPPGSFVVTSYHQALEPDGVPSGFFKGKVVLIGAKYSTGFSGSGKDTFVTPYSRFGAAAMSGVEVNANLLSTLRFDRTLKRLSLPLEVLILLCSSAGLAWLLLGLRPAVATIFMLTVVCAASAVAWTAGSWLRIWGNWFLFAGGVAPAALFVSVGRNYYIERTRREKITRAFEKYLSPEMVREVIRSGMDLKPGGVTRDVTALMTDIEGFSAVAEAMSAEEVSQMLIAYFSELTRRVFEQQGTVVQFVGDALYCVWGAPLDQPEQADMAVRSALAIQSSLHGKVFGRHSLKTRIGISTGDGLCGNLGSADRFDYAVIGDNTNLAARIEGANKKLGTHVLFSDSTKRALKGEWVLREVGEFLVAGRAKPVRLWEPIAAGGVVPPEWASTLTLFAEGLEAWRAGEWREATACFSSALAHRRPHGDGPSEFYLKMLRESRPAGSSGWISL